MWVVMAGSAVMLGWLLVVGVKPWMALGVLFLLAVHVIVARVVAETGLPFIRAYASPIQVCTSAAPAMFVW